MDEEFIESKYGKNEPTIKYLKDENIEFSKTIKKCTTVNKDDLNESAGSNHTSYQELPSVCSRKSQQMADEPEINETKLDNSSIEKEDTIEKSLFKKTFETKKTSCLNMSLQSITSQCTIDSLAKRVQSLVGPIDYRKIEPKKDESKRSVINYDSIYKELDNIQDTLRMQHSFNKHLEKITQSRAEIKDLLNSDKLSDTTNTTYSSATKVSPLSFSQSASSIDSILKNKYDYAPLSKQYQTDQFHSFTEDETQYFSKKLNDLKTDLEQLSLINQSINKDVNFTPKYDTPKLKNYLTTSLTRMNSCQYEQIRPIKKSAFESDADLLPNYKFNHNNSITTKKFTTKTSYSNTDTETIESSHSESDDAQSPQFSSDVYGSAYKKYNQTEYKPHGIYDRHKDLNSNKMDDNQLKTDDKLDPEYLRLMDKKLKKLIKKNLNKDLKTSSSLRNLTEKDNAISWEIEPVTKKTDDSMISQVSTAPSYEIAPPHPYLPLRDVPMHEIVKKLQREFELETPNTTKSNELNKLWIDIKNKVNFDQQEQPELSNLNNLINNPVRTLLENTALDQEKPNSLNRDKIKEMIEFQKQRHERRVKALEKLAKLERLQADKLKQILKINQNNDEAFTPQMYDLFIQQNSSNYLQDESNIGNQTIVDLDEAFKTENLSIIIDDKKIDQTKQKKIKFIEQLNNKSNVEVLNLKNTTIYEQPDNVIVVKENQNKDARCFFTIPNETKFSSKSETLIVPKYTKSISSYSMTNLSNKENSEPKKLSLQEAFETYRFDLISRSRQRQKEIQFRAEQRQTELEFEAQQIENYHKRLKTQQMNKKLQFIKKKNEAMVRNSTKGLMFEINVDNFMHKRQMTQQDIKQQTKKMYEKLPEVKQKQLQQRAEEIKRNNRLKSSIYRKVIINNLFSN